MSPESFDALLRALGSQRSRRAFLGVFATTAMAATPAIESLAGKRKKGRKNKDKNKRNKKGNRKDKNTSSGGCMVRHSEQEILTFIAKAAQKYGQSESAMVRVARCESVLDPCAVKRSGPYYGLFQFLKSTWQTTPYGDRDIYDPEAQSLATGWMWKQGRKNEWVCQ